MAATETADTATPDVSGLTPEQINKYLTLLRVGQGLPNVQPDQTPVDTSGFWGGLRHGISLLGEAAGSPGPGALGALSPKEREQAGLQSLSRFGTGLMAASHYVPGQTLGSNLAQGFQAAERGYDTTARQAMGMLAARQNYAVESQHADLEKLRAALPLLSLQQQLTGSANTQKLLSGEVTPGANIGAGGSIGNYTVPPELLPHYQAAAEKYGVPVELLIAQHKQESNLSPGATGGAGEVGLGQILPATAKSPGFGMAGADPKALRDPAANIDFSARYLAARAKAAGADLRTPEGVTKALKAYNGGGDPNYVQNVTRYIPGAQKALAGGAPAAPTPVGQNPNAKVQIPPPATTPAAPGQATMPPPEPPLLAGGAQTAGPGGPTGTAIPTLPPAAAAASAADVTDIEAGMANAQANPLVHQPGAVVTARAGGQQPTTAAQYPPIPIAGGIVVAHPGSYSEFRAREYVPPPATEDFNPNLSPKRQAAFDAARQGIQQRIANRPNLPIAQQQTEATKIIEDRAALEAKLQEEMASKAQDAAVKRSAYDKEQDTRIQTRYEKEADKYDKAAAAQQAQTHAVDLARINADFDKDKEGAKIAMEGDKQRMKDQATAAAAALSVSDQIRQLPALMSKLPPGGLLSSLMGQYPQLASGLEAAGIVDPGTADNIAIFTGLTNHLSSQLRATGAGPMSDKDLASFKTTMPRLLESPEGRQKATAFLQNIADRVVETQEFTNDYFNRTDPKTGKPAHNLYHLKDAINAPRKLDENGINIGGLGPVIPAAPKFEGPGSAAAAREWLRVHTQSGRPYTAWIPDERGVLTQQLMVRE
jgi:soluble lytic murein transglycosylase-like protein